MVPTLLWVGSVLNSVFGVIVPCGLNDNVAASVPTSCTPELVNSVTWFRPLVTTRTSINSET